MHASTRMNRRIYPRNSTFGEMYFKHKGKHWVYGRPQLEMPIKEDFWFNDRYHTRGHSYPKQECEATLNHHHAMQSLLIYHPVLYSTNGDNTLAHKEPDTTFLNLRGCFNSFMNELETIYNDKKERYEITYKDRAVMFTIGDDIIEDIYNVHRISDCFKKPYAEVLEKIQARFTNGIALIKQK